MSRQHLLQSIIATSQKLKCSLASRHSCTDIHALPSSKLGIPPLRLEALMASFQGDLQRSGLLPVISQLASRKATELAAHYQQSYQRLCTILLASPRSPGLPIDDILQRLRNAFESLYVEKDLKCFSVNARRTQSEYVSKVKWQESFSTTQERRPVFNHEWTPMLEIYFQANAYPSTADRRALAQKTDMTPRQIEVWFQNHRNRAKKEGRRVNRGSSLTALNRALEYAENSSSPISSNQSRGSSPSENSCSGEASGDEIEYVRILPPLRIQEPIQVSSPLDLGDLRPPHAYPTKYPPHGVEDPFPHQSLSKFPPPDWRRCASTSERSMPPVDVNEIVDLFASKLHLRDAQGVSEKRSQHLKPWFASRITLPPPAPLPSLMRSPQPKTPTPFSPIATFPLPSKDASSNFHTNVRSRNRKPAPLRRNWPSALSFSNRTSSPTFCTAEPRTPSLTSISSQSRSTSRSSSSSAETDGPATPPALPLLEFPPPLTLNLPEVDLRIFDDLFHSLHGTSQLDGFVPFKELPSPMLSCDTMLLPSLHAIEAHS